MTIAEKIKNYMNDSNKTITDMSEVIQGVGRSALSQYLNGKYASDPTNIENKLIAFLETVDPSAEISVTTEESIENNEESFKNTDVVNRGFLRSKDANGILGVAAACQDDHLLGCIVGKSGLGKTMALKTYATLDKVIYIECDDSMNGRDLVAAIEEGIGLPEGKTSKHKRIKDIKTFFRQNPGYLIIIDEADKLINRDTISKLEILRTLHDGTEKGATDESTVGIIVAGELRLEAHIKNYNDRFANRIDQRYKLVGLTREDVVKYVEGLDITDRALEELIHRATNSKNGCFRLLRRTMKNVKRVLGNRTKITLDVIKEASEMMML